MIPAELGAEAAAYKEFIKRFGEIAFHSHIVAEAEESTCTTEYFAALTIAIKNYDGEWTKLTKRQLRRHRDLFSKDELLCLGNRTDLESLRSNAKDD